MKTNALIIVFVCLFLSVFSVQAQQSSVRKIGSFRGVMAGEGIDVYLKKGLKESVKIVTDGSADRVITELVETTLRIHMRDDIGADTKSAGVKVYVTYVEIDKIFAGTKSNVFSDGVIKMGSMEITSSTAGKIDLNIDVANLTVSASTTGVVTLEGKTKAINLKVNTSGEVNAFRLASEKCEAIASTGGKASVMVSNDLVARADTGAAINYKGNPGKADTNSQSGGFVVNSN